MRMRRQPSPTAGRAATLSVALSAVWGLQNARNGPTIGINRPAKPMWTSVLKLKSRGFFNARKKFPLFASGGAV